MRSSTNFKLRGRKSRYQNETESASCDAMRYRREFQSVFYVSPVCIAESASNQKNFIKTLESDGQAHYVLLSGNLHPCITPPIFTNRKQRIVCVSQHRTWIKTLAEHNWPPVRIQRCRKNRCVALAQRCSIWKQVEQSPTMHMRPAVAGVNPALCEVGLKRSARKRQSRMLAEDIVY